MSRLSGRRGIEHTMEAITVKLDHQTLHLEGARGERLLSVLQRGGVAPPSPCGGAHTCGKCLIRIQGPASPIEADEAALLKGRDPALRLACCAKVEGPCQIILETGGGMEVQTGHTTHSGGGTPLFSGRYGAAVDIGTTTLAAYLYDPAGGTPRAVTGAANSQGRYGADVITRIAYDSSDASHTLTRTIREQVGALLLQLLEQVGAQPEALSAAVLTGNTTMLHLLAGLETCGLAQAPFTPISLFGGWADFSLPGLPKTRCYLPRCISTYVGADITCGILSSGMLVRPGNLLLVDVGTNGEMALKTEDGRLVCCSTAAGPAFEGSGISSGSGAIPGAISHMWIQDGKACCETIGGQPAASLCGSGLIDALSVCLALGEIAPDGRITARSGKQVSLAGTQVCLSQRDIRQAQLAKGAIRAGIDTLLHTCGVDCGDLDGVLLCGGFGFHLRPDAAEAIGMLPPGCGAKTTALGNAAGAGAAAILLDRQQVEATQEIAAQADCINLSTDQYFLNDFMRQLHFPERAS